MLCAGAQTAHISPVQLRQMVFCLLVLLQHDFQRANNQTERGAQFVADRGKETALQQVRFFSHLPGAADLLAENRRPAPC